MPIMKINSDAIILKMPVCNVSLCAKPGVDTLTLPKFLCPLPQVARFGEPNRNEPINAVFSTSLPSHHSKKLHTYAAPIPRAMRRPAADPAKICSLSFRIRRLFWSAISSCVGVSSVTVFWVSFSRGGALDARVAPSAGDLSTS